jgi:hypothetical protein
VRALGGLTLFVPPTFHDALLGLTLFVPPTFHDALLGLTNFMPLNTAWCPITWVGV